jgi:Flp pilus assembly protein TadD
MKTRSVDSQHSHDGVRQLSGDADIWSKKADGSFAAVSPERKGCSAPTSGGPKRTAPHTPFCACFSKVATRTPNTTADSFLLPAPALLDHARQIDHYLSNRRQLVVISMVRRSAPDVPCSPKFVARPLVRFGAMILAALSLSAQPQENKAAGEAAGTQSVQQALAETKAALDRKDYAAAKEASLRATAIDPRNQAAWWYLGWTYDKRGENLKAEAADKTLVAINPRHPSAYNSLGIIYQRMRRVDDAIAFYSKQIEVAPRNRYAPGNLASLMALRGEWEEALRLGTVAAELNPNDSKRLIFLGRAQMMTDHVDDARRSFDRALALPHDHTAENSVAWALANAGFDLEKSWKLISSAVDGTAALTCQPDALSDDDKCTQSLRHLAFMLDTAGWVLYRQGKIDAAEPYLWSSYAINPRGETELHLVSMLARSGRLADAITYFTHARTRSYFPRLDTDETLRDLATAAGGDSKRDALLERASPTSQSAGLTQAEAIALVDGDGKVIDARVSAPAPDSLVSIAKSLTLPALSWPGYSMRSIRTIEFNLVGSNWSVAESYAGETQPPLPCITIRKPLPPPISVTKNSTDPSAPAATCPAGF